MHKLYYSNTVHHYQKCENKSLGAPQDTVSINGIIAHLCIDTICMIVSNVSSAKPINIHSDPLRQLQNIYQNVEFIESN